MRFNHQQMYITLIITFISTIAFSPTSLAMQKQEKFTTDGHLGAGQMRDHDSNRRGPETAGMGTTVNLGPCKSTEETKQNIPSNLLCSSMRITHAAHLSDPAGNMTFSRSIPRDVVPPLLLPQSPHQLGGSDESDHNRLKEEMLHLSMAHEVPFLNPQESRRKIAVVTGASQGIGEALTRLLLKNGLDVIGISRNADALEQLRNEQAKTRLNNKNLGVLQPIVFDLSKINKKKARRELNDQFEKFLGSAGRVHFLVNNAGIITPLGTEALVDAPIEEILGNINTNIVAPLALVRMLSGYYVKGTRIMFVSSVAGDRPGGATACYSISKCALDRIVQTQYKDRPRNGELLFASVNPGNVETAIHFRDLRTPKEDFQRAEYFKQFAGKLLLPEIAGLYLNWLLLSSSAQEYTKGKHTVYDKEQQKQWWNQDPLIDPYLTAPAVQASSSPHASSPHASSPHASSSHSALSSPDSALSSPDSALSSPLSAFSAPEPPITAPHIKDGSHDSLHSSAPRDAVGAPQFVLLPLKKDNAVGPDK